MKDIIYSPQELDWRGVRFRDPIGRVFFLNGDYYRAIYHGKVNYVENLFKLGVLEKLIGRKLLVPIEYSDINVDNFGVVLKSKAATWTIDGHTYTRRTLKKAAQNWIEMNEILLSFNLGLIDAHLYNIILTGKCIPKWVDLGSIQPLKEIDMGMKEFFKYQLYPLLIFESQKKLDRIVRLLIQHDGISGYEFLYLNGFGFKGFIVVFSFYVSSPLIQIFNRSLLGKKYCRNFLLKFLRLIVESIDVTPPKKFWTNYRLDSNDDDLGSIKIISDSRSKIIYELIKKANPKTILDVGANDGYFSKMSATICNKLLVTDLDEGAIEKFAKWVEKTQLDIEACYCIDDFHKIKHQAELVLGLALVHHLAISQEYKFDYIARRFSEMSNRYLITEFMPNGCGALDISPNPLPEHYNLNIFLSELNKFFKTVQQVDYYRPETYAPRVLIFCSK